MHTIIRIPVVVKEKPLFWVPCREPILIPSSSPLCSVGIVQCPFICSFTQHLSLQTKSHLPGNQHWNPFIYHGKARVMLIHVGPRGRSKREERGAEVAMGAVCSLRTTPDSWAPAGRQISWKCFSLVNFACGKLTVWFHLSLMGEPVPITRLNCELHSSPQSSPQPFQRGPRENLSSVCVLPQQRGGCNQVAPCFS